MTRLRVTIAPRDPADYEPLDLETPDVQTALAITDINVDQGDAEIWDGKRRLARISKRGNGSGTFWRVN